MTDAHTFEPVKIVLQDDDGAGNAQERVLVKTSLPLTARTPDNEYYSSDHVLVSSSRVNREKVNNYQETIVTLSNPQGDLEGSLVLYKTPIALTPSEVMWSLGFLNTAKEDDK